RDLRITSTDHITRAVLATARGGGNLGETAKLARVMWPDDAVTPKLIQRAATVPADTVSSGWAADVATISLPNFIATLAGPSSLLLTRALQVSFGNSAAISIPTLVSAAASATFRQQSQPIPVVQLDTSGPVTMTPKKIAVLIALTNEVARSANAEAFI